MPAARYCHLIMISNFSVLSFPVDGSAGTGMGVALLLCTLLPVCPVKNRGAGRGDFRFSGGRDRERQGWSHGNGKKGKWRSVMRESAKVFIKGLVICCLLAGSSPWLYGMEGPESVDLDSIVNLYGPVSFDHDMHTGVARCASCHHHTTGDVSEEEECLRCHAQSEPTDEVACSSCHAANSGGARLIADESAAGWVFHLERTGLKRVYHVKCLGCHMETSAPVGCEDCHPKREAD